MIKTIIIDDEPRSIQNLKLLLARYCKQVEVIATAEYPENGILLIQEYKPDLVFIDIEMPTMKGFEVLKQVADVPFKVIFITAYDEYEYAVSAIRSAALDYLLKPFDIDELISAVAKAEKTILAEKIVEKKETNVVNHLLYNQFVQKQKIALPTPNGIELIVLENIRYCQAHNTYTILTMLDDTNKIVCKSIKEFEAQLCEKGFFRIHREYLINLNYMKSYVKGRGGYVIMENSKELAVANERKDDFLAFLAKFWDL